MPGPALTLRFPRRACSVPNQNRTEISTLQFIGSNMRWSQTNQTSRASFSPVLSVKSEHLMLCFSSRRTCNFTSALLDNSELLESEQRLAN